MYTEQQREQLLQDMIRLSEQEAAVEGLLHECGEGQRKAAGLF